MAVVLPIMDRHGSRSEPIAEYGLAFLTELSANEDNAKQLTHTIPLVLELLEAHGALGSRGWGGCLACAAPAPCIEGVGRMSTQELDDMLSKRALFFRALWVQFGFHTPRLVPCNIRSWPIHCVEQGSRAPTSPTTAWRT